LAAFCGRRRDHQIFIASSCSLRSALVAYSVLSDYGVAELSGVGTTISGLSPAAPASVAADGSVASLNAGPVMLARPGIGEATLLPEASVASSAAAAGSQAAVVVDVPNEETADDVAPGGSWGDSVPVAPIALLASNVVLGIGAAIPVVGHAMIVPMVVLGMGPRVPKLS
jgi:hypothetical protein